MKERSYRSQAAGNIPVDLVLTHCRLVNVLSGEIEENASIAICGDEIVGIGADYVGKETIDVGGQYVYPALMDAHIHLESTKLTIPEAARIMSRYGTGTVVTDPHEIANVCGLDGISYQMDAASDNGRINVFFTVPSCVPALPDPQVETFGAFLGSSKLRLFLNHPWVIALGEMMNVPGVLMEDEKVIRKIEAFLDAGKTIDGHAPMLAGQTLNAYIYAGIDSDHESTSCEEAIEKVRRGMDIMIREGSSERNLDAILPAVNDGNATRFMFASDDLDPSDMMRRGHINHLVARAVKAGLSPIRALQMATIHPAHHFHLYPRLGAIRPGARADLVIAEDLVNFVPTSVMHGGVFVFRDGVEMPAGRRVPRYLRPAMNVRLPVGDELAVEVKEGSQIHLIDLVPGQILTQETVERPTVVDHRVVADPERGIAKVCVFERHRASGAFGIGFVRGFGMKCGAMGSSVGHDSHNIVVVGMNDADILRCASMIRDMSGGQAAVLGDKNETLPLPIGGLMSPESAEEVVSAEKRLDVFCEKELGVTLERPMAALSFMSLPVIPNIRITDQGLFRVAPGAYPQKISIFD